MTDESHDQAPGSGRSSDYPTMSEPTYQPPADDVPTRRTPSTEPIPAIATPPAQDPARPYPPDFNPPNVTPPNPWAPNANTPNPGPPTWGSAAQGWPPPPAPAFGPDTAPTAGPPPAFGTPGLGTPGYGTPGYGGPGYGAPGAAPGYGTPGYGAPGTGVPPMAGSAYGTPPPGGGWNYGYGPASWGPPPGSSRPPAAARRAIAAIAVLILVLASAGVGAAISSAMHANDTATSPLNGGNGSTNLGNGNGNGNGFGLGLGNGNSRTSNGVQPSADIVSKVEPAVVDIYTTINSGGSSGEAAGTGMIISKSGEILTNNHVIDGATSIRVQIVDTGATHTAEVVGYDVVDDVALLKMDGASDLKTVDFADASNVEIGDSVVAIGNAQGRGGRPTATAGSVTALDQKVTAGDEGTGNSETLHGMIQMSAPIEPGDSGGPLADTNGKVVGMNTAAAQSDDFFGQSGSSTAFAIPINKALEVVNQIRSGKASNTVHIGGRGILGVDIGQSSLPATSNSGAPIAQVQPDSPAGSAGMKSGDVITSINGKSVASGSDLTTLMFPYHPDDRVDVVWVDQSGGQHHKTVQLTEGPPT